MAGEGVADGFGGDVPDLIHVVSKSEHAAAECGSGTLVVSGEDETHPNNLILRPRRQKLPIRTETHTPDIQIPVLRGTVVLQMTDLLPAVDIEDLRAAVTPGRHEAAVMTEPHTADHALMRQVVDELDVQTARDGARVEDGVPVLALALEVRWELVRVELGELVADLRELVLGVLEVRGEDLVARRWGRAGDAGAAGVGLALLRCRWAAEAWRADERLARAWGGGLLGWSVAW